MRLGRLLRVLVALFAALLVAISVSYLAIRPDPHRTLAEQYAVYSAYIRARLTGESHDLGSTTDLTVIVRSTTASRTFLSLTRFSVFRFLVSGLTNAKRNMPSTHRFSLLDFAISNLESETFETRFDLPSRYVLVANEEAQMYGTRAYEEKFGHSYGYIVLSKVGFNRDLSEALLYTEHICGLCGGGEYVLMRKVNGRWVVAGESSTWVS
jgi:hypothetical protein